MIVETWSREHRPGVLAPTPEPSWVLLEDGFNLAREHEIESLFAVANGYVGTRASLAEGSALSSPATFVAGVYDIPSSTPVPQLAAVPDWMQLRGFIDDHEICLEDGQSIMHQRILDMRQGIFWRDWLYEDPAGRVMHIRGLRIVSLAERHLLIQVAFFTPRNYSGSIQLETSIIPPRAPAASSPFIGAASPPIFIGSPRLLRLHTRRGVEIGFAVDSRARIEDGPWLMPTIHRNHDRERWEFAVEMGTTYRLERIVALYTSRDALDPTAAALKRFQNAAEQGTDALIAAHVHAWKVRWDASDVQIVGDDDAQRALRFACYHLISAANPEDTHASIGARALTGPAYKGHVFWDTEIFMLPFYVFTHPPTARALLMYRYHTLDAAREKARQMGYRGALYAWESADTGEETTPPYVIRPDGTVVRIRAGEQEHHISADIAYAVWQYWDATGDDDFFILAGAEIILETARFWASRVAEGDDGLFHILKVIGPDEYHEAVDDNAYTNGMAQWNLERGAATAHLLRERWPHYWRPLVERLHIGESETNVWLHIARNLHNGLDVRTGMVEQFNGYFGLEYIALSDYAQRNVAMDVLLGADRICGSQVIKQADVLMLLYLLNERFGLAVQGTNFAYYEPRCGHGSSLSPSMHALFAARLGAMDKATSYFRQAANIDLANNMGNAAGGVHAAALGGLWQAVVFGFAGISTCQNGFVLTPHLPPNWDALRFRLQWRSQTLTFDIRHSDVAISSSKGIGSTRVTVGSAKPVRLSPGAMARWRRQGRFEWKEAKPP